MHRNDRKAILSMYGEPLPQNNDLTKLKYDRFLSSRSTRGIRHFLLLMPGPTHREGGKIVLYFVSPGATSMADAGVENFVIWFSGTQENAFLDTFSMNFAFVSRIFIVQ